MSPADSKPGPHRDEAQEGITRGDLLKGAAAGGAGILLGGRSGASAAKRPKARPVTPAHRVAGMNVLLFLTDQQRAIQHFPPGWARRNMPGLTRLQQHGLTFENAFTNACMCSPARSTLMSGYFPAQHGVKYTLETDMPPPNTRRSNWPPASRIPRPWWPPPATPPSTRASSTATSRPTARPGCPSDVNKYGFTRWDPPDAGANQSVPEEGGGIYDNDGRFMNSDGTPRSRHRGRAAVPQLGGRGKPAVLHGRLTGQPARRPASTPRPTSKGATTNRGWTARSSCRRRPDEDLSTKPTVQEQFLKLFNASGPIPTPQMKRNYLNFYGNLMKSSDAYLVKILDSARRASGLLENTLVIATADHGEMGTAHGGLRQKNFNFYEESTRVPLVYSNPRLFKKPRPSDALVSHVDFLPDAREPRRGAGRAPAPTGRESTTPTQILAAPRSRRRTTPSSPTTIGSPGRPVAPIRSRRNHIVSIRERRYKLARYYDADGKVPDQWEMYDLKTDPLERTNLAYRHYKRSPTEAREYRRLRRKLANVEKTRLKPLS